jgi:hypothetical protein
MTLEMCFFIFLVTGDVDIPNEVHDEVRSHCVSLISVTRSIINTFPLILEHFFFFELAPDAASLTVAGAKISHCASIGS